MNKPFSLTTPCSNCPFRTDVPGYLRKGRVTEIERATVRSEFWCHKTVKHRDTDDDDAIETPDGPMYERQEGNKHCAGALILLEKIGRPSQMMRIAERLGIYDPSKLDMGASVYDSFAQMRKAMPR